MAKIDISITEQQLRSIRRRVREGLEDIKAGRFTEYEGREGLKKLADEVKARGAQTARQTNPWQVMRYRGRRSEWSFWNLYS
jgi:Arc/MetJ-type ribon-helix-helix transcriptional regulator